MARSGLFFALLLLAGCHSRDLAPAPRQPAPQLPLTGRTPIEPEVADAPEQPATTPPARPTQYRRLTAAECRCLAIEHAPLAADLDTHPDNTPPRKP